MRLNMNNCAVKTKSSESAIKKSHMLSPINLHEVLLSIIIIFFLSREAGSPLTHCVKMTCCESRAKNGKTLSASVIHTPLYVVCILISIAEGKFILYYN